MAINWEKLSVLLEAWAGAGTLAVTTMAINTDPTIMAIHPTTLAPLDFTVLVIIGEFFCCSIFRTFRYAYKTQSCYTCSSVNENDPKCDYMDDQYDWDQLDKLVEFSNFMIINL